jgi:hypothetical protein
VDINSIVENISENKNFYEGQSRLLWTEET